jgi:hypothetical protein
MNDLFPELKERLNQLQLTAEQLGTSLQQSGELFAQNQCTDMTSWFTSYNEYSHSRQDFEHELFVFSTQYAQLKQEDISDQSWAHYRTMLEHLQLRDAVFNFLNHEYPARLAKLKLSDTQPITKQIIYLRIKLQRSQPHEHHDESQELLAHQHSLSNSITHLEAHEVKLKEEQLLAENARQEAERLAADRIARDAEAHAHQAQLAHQADLARQTELARLEELARQQALAQEEAAKAAITAQETVSHPNSSTENDAMDDGGLIFDDAFQIGKNMSLLKGRDMDPVPAFTLPAQVAADLVDSIHLSLENDSVHSDQELPDTTRNLQTLSQELQAEMNSLGIPQHSKDEEQSISEIAQSSIHTKSPTALDPTTKILSQYARGVLQSQGETRDRLLIALIWELISHQRYDLAAQLAQRVAIKKECPPPWLLRALCLNSHLYYSQGHISRSMEENLAQYRLGEWGDVNSETSEALGYLLRAALLRLSIISPGKVTSSILKSFPIQDGEVQLYNICSRLVYFGNQPHSSSTSLFANSRDGSLAETNSATITNYKDEIEAWHQLIQANIVQFRETGHLHVNSHWSLYQSVNQAHSRRQWSFTYSMTFLTSISRILTMIHNEERGASSRVRQELKRLNDAFEHPVSIGLKAPRPISALAIEILLPSPVRKLIDDGIGIADRWLANQNSQTESPRWKRDEIDNLKEEFQKRHLGLERELIEKFDSSLSQTRRIAIDCLRNEFARVRNLLFSTPPLPKSEPIAQHILNTELLRTELVDFTEDWKSTATLEQREQAVLKFIAHHPSNWSPTIQKLAQHGHWKILVQLKQRTGLLANEEMRTLNSYLDFYNSPEHQNFLREFDNLKLKLRESHDSQSITADEYQACHWRIDQLSNLTPDQWNITEITREITILKKFIALKTQESQARHESQFQRMSESLTTASQQTPESNSPAIDTTNSSTSLRQNQSQESWILDF